MYVKNRMTKDPICITKDTSVREAIDLLEDNGFHRLPVVDKNNKVIGLITDGIIQKNTPGKATSLQVHELNYLLQKTTVETIMTTDVITCGPDLLLEEAADVMRRHSISCLPVIKNDKIVGIITQKDIFAAFIDLMGTHEKGGRVVIEIDEDKPGIMANITKILGNAEVNISNLAVYKDDVISVVIRFNSCDTDEVVKLLEKEGYKVTDIRTNE